MAKLYIIGVGIYPDYISVRALEVLKKLRIVFYECYTSPIPKNLLIEVLRRYVGDIEVVELSRKDIEDYNCRKIIDVLNKGEDTALLVPGDPMIATTHTAVRIIVRKLGHDVEVIHGVSILNSIISLLGLSPYRIGPIATITYPRLGVLSERPYEITKENLTRNLHTILLLDIKDDGGFMPVDDAIKILKMMEDRRREGIFCEDRLMIVVSRLGYPNMKVKVDILKNFENYSEEPPHSIVIPAVLSPVERELLEVEFNVDPKLLDLSGKIHL